MPALPEIGCQLTTTCCIMLYDLCKWSAWCSLHCWTIASVSQLKYYRCMMNLIYQYRSIIIALAETKEAVNEVSICHLWPNHLRPHGSTFLSYFAGGKLHLFRKFTYRVVATFFRPLLLTGKHYTSGKVQSMRAAFYKSNQKEEVSPHQTFKYKLCISNKT